MGLLLSELECTECLGWVWEELPAYGYPGRGYPRSYCVLSSKHNKTCAALLGADHIHILSLIFSLSPPITG